jgi:hypothetical protein
VLLLFGGNSSGNILGEYIVERVEEVAAHTVHILDVMVAVFRKRACLEVGVLQHAVDKDRCACGRPRDKRTIIEIKLFGVLFLSRTHPSPNYPSLVFLGADEASPLWKFKPWATCARKLWEGRTINDSLYPINDANHRTFAHHFRAVQYSLELPR